MGEWMVTVGDCREVMAAMDAESVDAIVCDPPYGLEFMGKGWDAPWKANGTVESVHEGQDKSHPFRDGSSRVRYGTKDMPAFQAWFETVAVEALRVLKPGGHLLAFGGTRTFHRMTVAIEDAGFEVRDCLSWLYGSGFPKSLNVGKAIDKAAGAEREVVGTKDNKGRVKAEGWGMSDAESDAITSPATDEAARWEGWGTALKPAWEPIVMARKPLIGTVAGNVLAHGTGGLNIDGSRIAGVPPSVPQPEFSREMRAGFGASAGRNGDVSQASGRWPANVLLDEGAAAALDEQTGPLPHGWSPNRNGGFKAGWKASGGADQLKASSRPNANGGRHEAGTGASRFFHVFPNGEEDASTRFRYVAKASRRDRNEGLDGMPEGKPVFGDEGGTYQGLSNSKKPQSNSHPTVKPTALMRHLVKLVTPPGGLVLDPFTGSGSTGKAAILEGFRFHGIEQDAEYAEIARARIAWAADQADEEPDQPTLM